MSKPIPDYVARIAAMIEGERIVIPHVSRAEAVRYHCRKISPDLRVSVWKDGVRVELRAPRTTDQLEKARKKALTFGNSNKYADKADDFDDGLAPNPTAK